MTIKAYGAYAGHKPLEAIDIKGDVKYRFVVDCATLAA